MAKIQVKPIEQNVVVNLKVEQIVRSIYFGFDDSGCNPLDVSPVRGLAITLFEPDTFIEIGIADARGYRFTGASASALIKFGYHPSAGLVYLSQMRLNGEPVVCIKDAKLVAMHAAVVQCARDLVFNYEKVQMIKGTPRVVGKPILENYRRIGKPKNFA